MKFTRINKIALTQEQILHQVKKDKFDNKRGIKVSAMQSQHNTFYTWRITWYNKVTPKKICKE